MPIPTNDNKDYIKRIVNGAANGNAEEMEQAFVDYANSVQESIVAEAQALRNSNDSAILAQRGIRQLTAKEEKFYNTLIEGMKADKALNSLSNADKTIPETVIESVFEDLKKDHPLLNAIDSLTATGLTKMIVSTDAGNKAVWGALNSQIVTEISSGFAEIDVASKKLSAFIPISNDMLALGARFLDKYIRTILAESIALGLEYGVVYGTGKDEPTGMVRDLSSYNVSTGYALQTPTSVTDFGKKTYGNLISRLAKTRGGKSRKVSGLCLICNTDDYYNLVMPASTIETNDGRFVGNVFPVPTDVYTVDCLPTEDSSHNPLHYAVLGIPKNYFLGISYGGKEGVIEKSDQYQFLEDNTVYKTKLLGNGQPKDNTSFLLLDISDVEELFYRVGVVGIDDDEEV